VSEEAGTNASRFNVLNHVNVPLHEVLVDEEAKALLKKYGIVKEQLPKIRSNDPAAKVIGAQPGQIVRITRNSPTAGKAVAYRLTVEAL
jgi:DNA-directed RNA polymerase subunit H